MCSESPSLRITRRGMRAISRNMTISIFIVMFVSAPGCIVFDASHHSDSDVWLSESHCREETKRLDEWDGTSLSFFSHQHESDCDDGCNEPCLQDSLPLLYSWCRCGIVVPALPMPQCWVQWRERRELPKGPDGARFQPLPTRPMFEPRSGGEQDEWWSSPQFHGQTECSYGKLPSATQWQLGGKASAPGIISETVISKD